MGRAFASLNCGMRGIESGGLFRRGGRGIDRCIRKRARHRIGHDFEQLGNGGELALIELVHQLVYAISIHGHYCRLRS